MRHLVYQLLWLLGTACCSTPPNPSLHKPHCSSLKAWHLQGTNQESLHADLKHLFLKNELFVCRHCTNYTDASIQLDTKSHSQNAQSSCYAIVTATLYVILPINLHSLCGPAFHIFDSDLTPSYFLVNLQFLLLMALEVDWYRKNCQGQFYYQN